LKPVQFPEFFLQWVERGGAQMAHAFDAEQLKGNRT